MTEAQGEIVCQWDDDDLYHPDRLTIQYEHLVERRAEASLLTDQLHLFADDGHITWDDWTCELFPHSLIQGTLMARRSGLGRYPDTALGEDTAVLDELVAGGARIAAVQDHGWCYVYVYDGRNAWSREHHRAIAEWKAVTGARLSDEIATFTARLAEYPIAPRVVEMRSDPGSLPITLGGFQPLERFTADEPEVGQVSGDHHR